MQQANVNTSGHRRTALLALGALGVVFGDIGTSPLYALKECFHASHGLTPSVENVLGILSLIFWSLTIIVSLKYIAFIMRADNNGEGGIMAQGCPMFKKRSVEYVEARRLPTQLFCAGPLNSWL